MEKIVTCPVKRFPGTVTLRDPMTFAQVARWGEAITGTHSIEDVPQRYAAITSSLYPLVVELVESWNLKNILPGVTVANFPNASPGTSAASIHSLIAWLINECHAVYEGAEDDDPNV